MQEEKPRAARSPASSREAWTCILYEFSPSLKVGSKKIKIKQNTVWVKHTRPQANSAHEPPFSDSWTRYFARSPPAPGHAVSISTQHDCLFTRDTGQPHKYSKLVFMCRCELCPQINSRRSWGRGPGPWFPVGLCFWLFQYKVQPLRVRVHSAGAEGQAEWFSPGSGSGKLQVSHHWGWGELWILGGQLPSLLVF